MNQYELKLPAMGEGVYEATITRWMIRKGDRVIADQPVVEIATDKVDSEISSPVEGKILRLVFEEGEIAHVGSVLAIIETEVQLKSDIYPMNYSETNPDAELSKTISLSAKAASNLYNGHGAVSPLLLFQAKAYGLTAQEVFEIAPSGENTTITRHDLHEYLIKRVSDQDKKNNGKANPPAGINSQNSVREIQIQQGDEVIEMDRMRKLIAGNMLNSIRTAAHVTSFLEADITPIILWRENNKDAFIQQKKIRLTFTPIFCYCIAKALKDFPRINVSVKEDSIIVRKNINIGIATALSDGNLIVPVIKNADRESITGLAMKITDLAGRARNGNLLPEEVKGSTFTITNIGQYNSLTGTPIINQPESAIMAFGTIIKKPWAVRTSEGYGIAVRDIIMLSLTYDHRIIDGALGGSFLSRVVQYLENFGQNVQPD